jgi:hypothetical protein
MSHKQSGFTVVELLTTLIIAALYMTMFFQLYTLIDTVSSNSHRLALANEVTYRKLQQYENKNFDDIQVVNGTNLAEIEDFKAELSTNLPGEIEAKVYTAEITPTLKVLTVRAKYGNTVADPDRIIEYSSYIQESGLGR